MTDRKLYLTASEAAAVLGVTRGTLYSYVSRRGIRTRRDPGERESLYWKSDILKAKETRGPIASDKTAPQGFVKTGLTFVTDDGPYYRGTSVLDAADTCSLEDVAALLWGQDKDSVFTARLPKLSPDYERLLKMADHLGVADRAAMLMPLVESLNPRSYDLSPAGMAATGADALRVMTSLLLRTPSLDDAPVHDQIGDRLGLDEDWRDIVRRLLVLSAENGLESSTYVVRAASSVGITPYRSVLTGLIVSTGRRQAIGRIDSLGRLVDEVLSARDPEEPIIRRLREGETLPGFQSSLYPKGDPRGQALLDRLEARLSNDPQFRRLQAALSVVQDTVGQHPDFALLSLFVNRKIGLDYRDPCFFLGRSVGWIAHAIEQQGEGQFHRMPLVYTGPLPDEGRGRG